MTLVGLVPPLCDNGSMLVDGGYGEFALPHSSMRFLRSRCSVDNLPVSCGKKPLYLLVLTLLGIHDVVHGC